LPFENHSTLSINVIKLCRVFFVQIERIGFYQHKPVYAQRSCRCIEQT